MSEAAFQPFPKMGRLTRTIVVTEKIDGTNAQVNIFPEEQLTTDLIPYVLGRYSYTGADMHVMLAGSRTRYIAPGKNTDNAGFAAWVAENAPTLWQLGPGRHFGEWWDKAIQCGYGLQERRFSLFNTSRWADRHMGELIYEGDGQVGSVPNAAAGQLWAPRCCYVVPVLFEGLFSEHTVLNLLEMLKARGSVAAPGFMQPEGVVIFHTATGTSFKKTLKGDESPKALHKPAQSEPATV